jgi:hypothetical protein
MVCPLSSPKNRLRQVTNVPGSDIAGLVRYEKGRLLRRPKLILDAIFCYFNARLVQYHEASLLLQPTSSETSVHSA